MRILFIVDKIKATIFFYETAESLTGVKVNQLFYHISLEIVIDKCLYWRLPSLWSEKQIRH